MPFTLEQVAFAVLAVVILGSALMVATLKNIFHCLLYMALCFLGVAGIYLLLAADFLAAVQVLIYIGGLVVLIMFALMMTHRVMAVNIRSTLRRWWYAPLPLAVVLFAILVRVFVRYPWAVEPVPEVGPITGILGRELLLRYVLPFELASIVLLVAMIGAIILAKEDKDDGSS